MFDKRNSVDLGFGASLQTAVGFDSLNEFRMTHSRHCEQYNGGFFCVRVRLHQLVGWMQGAKARQFREARWSINLYSTRLFRLIAERMVYQELSQ